MLDQSILALLGIPDSNYLVDNIIPPISSDFEIFLHSILVPKEPNDLPTIVPCDDVTLI